MVSGRPPRKQALNLTLGEAAAAAVIDARIDGLRKLNAETILIGGPPCQAYSLIGRARNKGTADYKPEEDLRHFLYKEYIRILNCLQPVAFVMENVKGMLLTSVQGQRIFEQVAHDLQNAGGSGLCISYSRSRWTRNDARFSAGPRSTPTS